MYTIQELPKVHGEDAIKVHENMGLLTYQIASRERWGPIHCEAWNERGQILIPPV